MITLDAVRGTFRNRKRVRPTSTNDTSHCSRQGALSCVANSLGTNSKMIHLSDGMERKELLLVEGDGPPGSDPAISHGFISSGPTSSECFHHLVHRARM